MKRNLSTLKSAGIIALLAFSLPLVAASRQPVARTSNSMLKAYAVSPIPQTSTVFESLEIHLQNRNGVAQVTAAFTTLSEMGVVSFQILWATDPGGVYQPASDVLPAQGVDGSEYNTSFVDPDPEDPVYMMIIALMADGSTQTSEAVFVDMAPIVGLPSHITNTSSGSHSAS